MTDPTFLKQSGLMSELHQWCKEKLKVVFELYGLGLQGDTAAYSFSASPPPGLTVNQRTGFCRALHTWDEAASYYLLFVEKQGEGGHGNGLFRLFMSSIACVNEQCNWLIDEHERRNKDKK